MQTRETLSGFNLTRRTDIFPDGYSSAISVYLEHYSLTNGTCEVCVTWFSTSSVPPVLAKNFSDALNEAVRVAAIYQEIADKHNATL